MPHLHLSTSANLVENVDVPDILEALVGEFSKIESIDSASVKAYHSLFNTWVMGDNAPAGFAHLEVKLMTGRPAELLGTISDRLYAILKDRFSASLMSAELSLTLELVEMPRGTYRK